ncbi:MAG: caspase family protein [Pyrinomonadaceae bacterium]
MRPHTHFALACLICCLSLVVPAAAQRPQIEIQTGHTDGVRAVAFSPDGKLLASGSLDKTVIVWELATHRELRVYRGNSFAVNRVAFSPDGKLLAAAGGYDSSTLDVATLVVVWDVETGRIMREFKEEPHELFAIAFSPDSKTLAIGGTQGKTLKLWNVTSGRVVREISSENATLGHVGLAFTPDGKNLATLSSEEARLWNVATGISVRAFDVTNGQTLALSPDGKTLAIGYTLTQPSFFDVATGTPAPSLACEYCPAISYSPDGKTIATSVGGAVKAWDSATRKQLFESPLIFQNFHTQEEVTGLAVSPDGRTVAACAEDGSNVALLDVTKSVGEPFILEGRRDLLGSIAANPNGKAIAVNSNRYEEANIIKVWDAASGGMRSRVMPEIPRGKGETGGAFGLTYSPDGKLLAYNVQVSYDNPQYEVKLLDADNVEVAAFPCDFDGGVLTFSPDGRLLAGAGGGADAHNGIYIWDVARREQLRTIPVNKYVIELQFKADGKTLFAETMEDFLLLNAESGKLLSKSPITIKDRDRISPSQLSPDGKTYVGVADYKIFLADVATRRVLHRFDFNAAARFSANSKQLITTSENSKTIIWDVASGEEIATLLTFGDNDWLVITPDGLFDGSPAAWNKVLWRFSNALYDVAPAEAFFSDFYYPGLLTEIMRGQHPKAPQSIAQKDRRQPQVNLMTEAGDASAQTAMTVPGAGVQIKINNAPAGAQDVRLFRNGSLVKVWHGDVLQGKTEATLTVNVPLIAGVNRLTAYAFNHDNVKSSDSTLNITGADSLKRKGVAYVLAVGVNSYANKDFDLKYAVADAQDFSDEWRTQQTKLQTFADTEIITLKDTNATKANILKALTDLKAKVKPEDALVIYFAGHGTAQDNRFYLIPHDLGYEGGRDAIDDAGLKQILAHSLSDLELQDALEGVDAGQLLMVIDACNSGQVLESEEKRRGPMNSKGLAQLAYEKGMYILTAAQSYQAAQEASKFGHGFLTFALVEEGIKQSKADDEPKDGSVLVREWFNYATQRVPQMQVELMKETNGRGVKVAFVKGEEQIADPAERNVQRPRVFYRREVETRPLVIAKPQ